MQLTKQWEVVYLLSDEELYLLLEQSPEKGLEKIMDQYMALVHTIVYGKLSGLFNKYDIEECVSDIFYEVYKNIKLIDLEKGSFKAYLAVLAKRRAIDFYRKQKRNVSNLSMNEFDSAWMVSDVDIDKSVIEDETSEILIRAVKELGEPDSQIMIRKYYFGESTKAIAKILGIKENTIDKKVSRALGKLEKILGGIL